MKLLLAVIALVSFGLFVPNVYGDNLTLNLAAGTSVNLTGVVNGNADVFTYDHAAVPIFQGNTIAGIYNINFTATYVDAGTFPPGVASELLITESCVDVMVGAPSAQCNGLSLTYDNTNLGALDLQTIVGLGVNINADINGVDIAGIDIGTGLSAGLGGGSETLGFGNPPPSASPTPEPGTLSLMGTGLLGVAGVIRRKFRG